MKLARDLLHLGWILGSAMVCMAALLLAYIKRNAARTSTDRFSRTYLKTAALCSLFVAIEVVTAEYRAFRIDTSAIPIDAMIASDATCRARSQRGDIRVRGGSSAAPRPIATPISRRKLGAAITTARINS